jgi:hypothetical protein
VNRSRGDDDQSSPWAGSGRRRYEPRYESRDDGRFEGRSAAGPGGRPESRPESRPASPSEGRYQGGYEARRQSDYERGEEPGYQRRRERPDAEPDSRPWMGRGTGGGGGVSGGGGSGGGGGGGGGGLGTGGRGPGGRGPGGRGPGAKENGPGGNAPIPFNIGTIAVLAGVLVVGIGIGTGLSSTTQGNQGNIASSQQLDMAVPDPEFCRQWGASAFVMDVEVYTTMNPSSSFVTQPTLKPGCVIRRENWSVLEKEGAITPQQMRQCKQRMNTFAYIGSVKDKPIVRCVYQTDISENKFVTKGIADDAAGVTPEADQF